MKSNKVKIKFYSSHSTINSALEIVIYFEISIITLEGGLNSVLIKDNYE